MRALVFSTFFFLTMNSAFAQERQWTLDASDREAFLVFGVPDTDDVGFSFWCEIGKPKISIFAPVPHAVLGSNKIIPIDLKIDDERFHIKAKTSQSSTSTASSVEAPVAPDGTVMKAVSKSQTISVQVFGHTASYPLIDADIAGLLRVCSGF